ncbi:MAG: acyclic terpene utilization AtuA family protein [Rhodobacteraceae bacterium]|nr:acyclic terpene utilization AtuA family protein [Paracoccaceae bacterium]
MPTRVLVPSGVLGLGFDRHALRNGIASAPDIIAIDGGSTDSGPYYLGAGVSKYSRAATLNEWKMLLQARREACVPLVLTTAGTCGTDATVDWMLEITRDAAAELGQTVRVAAVKSSQRREFIAEAFAGGRIDPLPHAPEISQTDILGCSNIVALAGVEQICAGIRSGADIVIAGRATDTSGIAALPIMNGNHPGAAWHGAKIAECGALCSTHPLSGVISVNFDENGFEVEPMADDARCTADSVSAHMLYENADPFILSEPGGKLDVSRADYQPVSKRRVRVSGSEWIASDRYTVKLEGAAPVGYQTTIIAILRDARYAARAAEWVQLLKDFLHRQIRDQASYPPEAYGIEFRLIGVNAALGALERRKGNPAEVGVLCIVSAECQAAANEIARFINPFLLHFPLTEGEELPTFAFPYSPAETERGPVYEFRLNHTLEISDPMECFALETHDYCHAVRR